MFYCMTRNHQTADGPAHTPSGAEREISSRGKPTNLVQGREGVRQAEAVHGRVCEPGAVDAGHDPVHDDRPRRCQRLEQARAALRGHIVDAEQSRLAAVCAQANRVSAAVHDLTCTKLMLLWRVPKTSVRQCHSSLTPVYDVAQTTQMAQSAVAAAAATANSLVCVWG